MPQECLLYSIGVINRLERSPRLKDEPQHKLTGKIITKLLKLFEIKTLILRSNKDLKKNRSLNKIFKKKKNL